MRVAATGYAAAALLLLSSPEVMGADKGQYWLFNPTPSSATVGPLQIKRMPLPMNLSSLPRT
jgi:hypothetical protein